MPQPVAGAVEWQTVYLIMARVIREPLQGRAQKNAGQPEGARAKRGLLNHYNETAGHACSVAMVVPVAAVLLPEVRPSGLTKLLL